MGICSRLLLPFATKSSNLKDFSLILIIASLILTFLIALDYINSVDGENVNVLSVLATLAFLLVPYYLSLWGILDFDYYLGSENKMISDRLDLFRKMHFYPQLLIIIGYWFASIVGALEGEFLFLLSLIVIFLGTFVIAAIFLLNLISIIVDKQYRIRSIIFVILLGPWLYYGIESRINMPLP